jgi:hypothetical protein
VLVTDLAATDATVTLRSWAEDIEAAALREAELRLRLHERLRGRGVFA